MRILYLHQYFTTPQMRGGGRSFELGRRLVAAGHEVHMIASDKSGEAIAEPEGSGWSVSSEAGIQVHWCPVPYANDMGFGARLAAFGRFAALAGPRAAKLGGDVVLATSTPLTIALPGVYASTMLGIPMVFEVRDLWPAVPIDLGVLRSRPTIAAARQLERFAYRNAARVIALSPGIRDGVVATGYPADRVAVIPNGSDLDQFALDDRDEAVAAFRARHEWLGDRPLIGYYGAISQANGVEWLVELAARLRPKLPELRVLIVGSGRSEDQVRALARRRGVLDETLFMLPPVPKQAIPAMLAATDLAAVCFVDSAPLHTGSPNKAFDAFAASTPVLMSFGGWLGQRVRQYGAGVVAEHGDLDVAEAGVIELLARPRAQREARAAALRLARDHFARDDLASQFEDVLCQAALRQGPLPCPTG